MDMSKLTKWLKNRFVLLALILVGLFLVYTFVFGGGNSASNTPTVAISQVLREAVANPSPIKEIQIDNATETIRLKYKDGTEKVSRREVSPTGFTRQLTNAGYDFATGPLVTVNESSGAGGILSFLTFLLPTALQ